MIPSFWGGYRLSGCKKINTIDEFTKKIFHSQIVKFCKTLAYHPRTTPSEEATARVWADSQ
jgi:hypothetical protein